MPARPTLHIALAALATTAAAARPCGPAWQHVFPGAGVTGPIRAMTLFDEDGPGANPPRLFAVGTFASAGGVLANSVARWDGRAWSPIGAGLTRTDGQPAHVYTAAVYDPDADGPAPAALFVGGEFTRAGGVPILGVAKWDGAQWSAVGAGFTQGASNVLHLLTHDPDAGGPAAPVLIMGGQFTHVGGVFATNIASWNGASWSAMGSGRSETVRDLVSHDPDADGPLPTRVIALTLNANTVPERIASWNGAAWTPIGWTQTSGNGRAYALASFDEDGFGPLPPRLFAGGDFETSMGAPGNRFLRWDSQSWTPVAGAPADRIEHLAAVDEDGDAATPDVLFLGGPVYVFGFGGPNGIARWDGQTWSAPGGGLSLNGVAAAFATFDPDGPAPLPALLCVGGSFERTGPLVARNFAGWTGQSWRSLSNGFQDQMPLAMTEFDPDAAGPLPNLLLFGGNFQRAGDSGVSDLAAWSRHGWIDIGASPAGTPNPYIVAFGVLPGDAPGDPSRLIVSGDFDEIGGVAAPAGLAAWDGSSWVAIPGGGFGSFAVTDDGPGGSAPVLYGGYSFGVQRFDGSTWAEVGTNFGQTASVAALPDPVAPAAGTVLYAYGGFTQIGAVNARRIARWNGQAWVALSNGMNSPAHLPAPQVNAMCSFDPDGAGPMPLEIVAVGRFVSAGFEQANNVARWNGVRWATFGAGLPADDLRDVASFDEDGPGPTPPALYAAGYGPAPLHRWDGAAWIAIPIAPAVTDRTLPGYPSMFRLAVFDDDAAGPRPPALVCLGDFLGIGGVSAEYAAVWSRTPLCCPGDCNLDDTVNFVDLNIVLSAYGSVGSGLPGDFDSDADVDFVDLNTVLGAYGSICR